MSQPTQLYRGAFAAEEDVVQVSALGGGATLLCLMTCV
jgi:hypothetical protein